jgi:hypothetical protein
MRATKAALIVLLCLFGSASVLPGCVTTNNGNVDKTVGIAVTGVAQRTAT